MCTATWLIDENGYELFFNRDELRTRKPALPPRIQERNGVAFVAPVDGDHGGTWIAVNEFGVTLCLLNHYAASVVALAVPSQQPALTLAGDSQRYNSRGLLVSSLVDSASQDGIASRLTTQSLADYKPFFLLAFEPGKLADMHVWDGAALESRSNVRMPVSSSSFATEVVVRRRKALFSTIGPVNATNLESYHKSRDPVGGAFSVCMSRDDAQTVSFSRVRVTLNQIEFSYSPRLADGTFAAPSLLECPLMVKA